MKDTAPVQKFMKNKLMVVYLAMLSSFPALSTDLYLPALPDMKNVFAVSEATMNLSLIIFFIAFSVFSLIWGPISDKYGRRPVLIIGSVLYLIASLASAFATNVWVLIIARALQGGGGAATTAMSNAIVKDVYRASRRERILAIVQAMVVICPTLAPLIGALCLNITSWRGIFILQAFFGVLVLIGSLMIVETIPEGEKYNSSILQTLSRLWVVLKNPPFTVLLTIFSIQNAAQMAFIGASAYIYQEYYGLSSTIYSLFFGFNAICMMTGPFVFMLLSKRLKRSTIILVCLIFCVASGAAMVGLANLGPIAFALSVMPSFVATSAIKPPGLHLMLEQQKTDTGSASSLIVFGNMVMGSVGIGCASIAIWDFAHLVGLLTLILSAFTLILWIGPGKKLTKHTD